MEIKPIIIKPVKEPKLKIIKPQTTPLERSLKAGNGMFNKRNY